MNQHLNELLKPRDSKINNGLSDAAFDQAVNDYVDKLLANEELKDIQFSSPAELRSKLEQEVRSAAEITEFGDYISLALNILHNESNRYLQEDEYETLIDSLNILEQNFVVEDPDLSSFSIPEESRQLILQVGIAKFNQGLVKDSLAILTLLTTLKPDEPDYWFRLGLIAQKCEKFELASNAFSAASQMVPDFIDIRINAAQMYLDRHMKEEAKLEFEEAKRIFESADVNNQWRDRIFEIEKLLA